MTRLVVIFGFLVAFSAGLAVGYRAPRTAGRHSGEESPTTRPDRRGGWLTAELGLSSEQQEQMKKIWSETTRKSRSGQDDQRRVWRNERDEAVAALIRPEDKDKYAQVNKAYSDRIAAVDQLARDAYRGAVEQTKAVLTPEQRIKYEDILKRHGPTTQRHTTRRTEDRATTRPTGVTQPSSRNTP